MAERKQRGGAPAGLTLVTGATGHVGTNLVRALCARGEQVRITTRPRSKRLGLEGLKVEEVPADLSDPASLVAAARGATRIYHLAASVRLDPFAPEKLRRANVEGTKAVLAAAQAAGVTRLVHCSSIAAIGCGTVAQPATERSVWNMAEHGPYPVTKRDAEVEVLRAASAGLDAVVVNPGVILGAWDVKPSGGAILLSLAKARLPVYPSGGTGFVGVDDVVDGLIRAMERGKRGERYILVGENLSYRELITQVARITGATPPRLRLPRRLVTPFAKVGDLIGPRYPKAFGVLNTPMVRSYFELNAYSSQKARDELGWTPRPMAEHIEQAFAWFSEHGYLDRWRRG